MECYLELSASVLAHAMEALQPPTAGCSRICSAACAMHRSCSVGGDRCFGGRQPQQTALHGHDRPTAFFRRTSAIIPATPTSRISRVGGSGTVGLPFSCTVSYM